MPNKLIDKIMDLLPIVSCQEATRLASKGMDQRLSLKELFLLKLHLMVCDLCKRFLKQIHGLRKIARNYKPLDEQRLPQREKDKMKQALENIR